MNIETKDLLDENKSKCRSEGAYYTALSEEMKGLGLESLTAIGNEIHVAEHCRTRFVLRNQHMIDDYFIDLLLNHPVFTTAKFWLDNRSKTDDQILDLLLKQPCEEVVRREGLYCKLPELNGYTDNQKSFASSIRLNMLDSLPDAEVNETLIEKMNANLHTHESEFWITIRHFKPDSMRKFATGERSYDKYIQEKKDKKKKAGMRANIWGFHN